MKKWDGEPRAVIPTEKMKASGDIINASFEVARSSQYAFGLGISALKNSQETNEVSSVLSLFWCFRLPILYEYIIYTKPLFAAFTSLKLTVHHLRFCELMKWMQRSQRNARDIRNIHRVMEMDVQNVAWSTITFRRCLGLFDGGGSRLHMHLFK